MDAFLIVDTGPLFAAADKSDAAHEACARLLATRPGQLIVPQLVVAEASHLMQTRLGAGVELLFLAELARGNLTTEPVAAMDWLRVLVLCSRYRDFPLGATDASVIACAERLGVRAVATTDRRHFAAVRPAHVEAFELLP